MKTKKIQNQKSSEFRKFRAQKVPGLRKFETLKV